MERVVQALTFNAELTDEWKWLWLMLEHKNFLLRQAGRVDSRHSPKEQKIQTAAKVHVAT